jgi:hypothetical protein
VRLYAPPLCFAFLIKVSVSATARLLLVVGACVGAYEKRTNKRTNKK